MEENLNDERNIQINKLIKEKKKAFWLMYLFFFLLDIPNFNMDIINISLFRK